MFGVKGMPSVEEARAEFESVLASPMFVRSPGLSRLLQYLFTKYLEGTTEEVKEYQIGVEVLGRPSTFDPAEDAAARVEAHRLRKRLREFYETEGRSHQHRIELPLGHYAIAFPPVTVEPEPDQNGQQDLPAVSNGAASPGADDPDRHRHRRAAYLILGGATLAVMTAGVWIVARGGHRDATPARLVSRSPSVAVTPTPTAARIPPVLASQNSVRIACGRNRPHIDRWGETWEADRDYEGGAPFELPRHFIARAYDPKLFQAGRIGSFTYKIPLAPGVYELHLFFEEGTYGPTMPAGGGEISRIFDVRANGQPLLTRFDIYSDAGGSNVADVRTFKDISPGPGQVLTLEFQSQTGFALVNAIEIIPATKHTLNPIRIVTQEGFYTDSAGALWKPDRYYSGGQTATHSVVLHGTSDPDLFARERYGHFDYAIPVGAGTYRLALYFAEEYFGPGNGGHAGTRVFDVSCNGVALLQEFDLLKEAGPDQAVIKTFHGLKPNGQGKLLVSFSPIHDYATLYALEVTDESN